jgi:ATP-dependent DNA helicase DinG
MPGFWYTTDRNQVRRSLAAIDQRARQEAEKP